MRIKLAIFIVYFFLNNSCVNNSKVDYEYDEKPNYINCNNVKFQFLNYVKSNIDEILPILIRELKRSEKDDELNTQRVMDGIQSLSFMNQWEKYETVLKDNCPETHQKFQEEVSFIFLTELARSSEFH